MAIVIDFNCLPASRRRPASAGGAGAEILFFTGVRYESAGNGGSRAVKARRRVRTARPKGTGRRCDPTSRPPRSS